MEGRIVDVLGLPNGIDFNTFYNGLEEMSMAPYGVLDHLFVNFAKSSTLNFEGFLKIVNLIKAKKTEDKIALILKLMDEDENGLLSFEEIVERCKKMLDEILERGEGELSLESMSHYISKQIFRAVRVEESEEIPIEKIRELIESNSQEAQVLVMMCCGDVNYLK